MSEANINKVIVIRGGGDLASGVIQKLHRTGFNVVVAEIEKPNFIRREVCYGDAIYKKEKELEGSISIYVKDEQEIIEALLENKIPVIIDPTLEKIKKLEKIIVLAVIDCIIAKKNIGLKKEFPITIALGPGFYAGKDADIVIETMRGHDLGKLIFQGEATPNTGIPGEIGGQSEKRVVYSPSEGYIHILRDIGSVVRKDDVIGKITSDRGEVTEVRATIDGIVRGMISENYYVKENLKIGDIDPRIEELKNCYTISDKGRSLGGAVLEALLILKNRNGNQK